MTTTSTKPAPSVFDRVSRGKLQKPHLILMHGPDGVGKSTFAAGAPSPLFLCSEDGTNNLDVTRLPLLSLEEVIDTLEGLASDARGFQTVVIDTLDWLETQVWAHVVAHHEKKISSIEDIPYGKGHAVALDLWKGIIRRLDALRSKGLNVIVLCHSKVKKFEDPSTPQGYERYQLKLHSSANTDTAALWREWVDAVLFANFRTDTTLKDTHRAFGDGTRVMYTERRPAFDAKNRHGMPFELPLSWEDYAKAVSVGTPDEPDTLERQIEGLLESVQNEETKVKIRNSLAKFKGNGPELAKLKNRVQAVLGETPSAN